MPCQNTISPRDNKWNWECWYGGLKIDNLRCWFFGPPSSNQCLLFQFYSIPTPCWMSLWDWNYPITPKTAASCHWGRTTQCKKRYKEFGSWKHHTYINTTEYIFALENIRTHKQTHSHICRHTRAPKHVGLLPSTLYSETQKQEKDKVCDYWSIFLEIVERKRQQTIYIPCSSILQHFVLNTSRKCLSLAPQAKSWVVPSAFGSLLSADVHNLVIGADIRYLADAAYNLSNLLISDHLMLMSMLNDAISEKGKFYNTVADKYTCSEW